MKSKDKSVCLTRLLLIIRLSLVVDLIFLIVHVHVQHTGMELEVLVNIVLSPCDLQGAPDVSLIGEPLCWACVLPPKSLIAQYAARRSFRAIPASASSAI